MVSMRQTTIDFTVREAQAQVNLAERVRQAGRVINGWLDGRSEMYSRVAGFSVTRRVVLRVNMVTAAVLVTAVCVEQAPLVAIGSVATAAWMTHRLNRGLSKDEKGGK